MKQNNKELKRENVKDEMKNTQFETSFKISAMENHHLNIKNKSR